jgi:hypothetical protein
LAILPCAAIATTAAAVTPSATIAAPPATTVRVGRTLRLHHRSLLNRHAHLRHRTRAHAHALAFADAIAATFHALGAPFRTAVLEAASALA